jgi:NTP pyrophosphatase (non-canonical NTP hydrolase)
MITEYTIETTRRALQKNGEKYQLDILIEECAELIQAILHLRRNRVNAQKVIEEIADVQVALQSAIHIFGSHFIDHEIICKTSRLDQNLNFHESRLQKNKEIVQEEKPSVTLMWADELDKTNSTG